VSKLGPRFLLAVFPGLPAEGGTGPRPAQDVKGRKAGAPQGVAKIAASIKVPPRATIVSNTNTPAAATLGQPARRGDGLSSGAPSRPRPRRPSVAPACADERKWERGKARPADAAPGEENLRGHFEGVVVLSETVFRKINLKRLGFARPYPEEAAGFFMRG